MRESVEIVLITVMINYILCKRKFNNISILDKVFDWRGKVAEGFYGLSFSLLILFEFYKFWWMGLRALDFEKLIELIVFSSGTVAVALKVSRFNSFLHTYESFIENEY